MGKFNVHFLYLKILTFIANLINIIYIRYNIVNKSSFSILPVRLLYSFYIAMGGTGSVYLGYVCISL